MNKRYIVTFFTTLLFAMLLMGSSASATSATAEGDAELQTNTRYVTELVIYNGRISPPSTYSYSRNGWRGTLTLQSFQFDGSRTLARYGGNISCSGTCPIVSSTSSQ
ncbi:hypothetical protein FLK61_24370 [Paenalkalicoccus suaedae]|uniref:Uncharacterized protein n=1 Tax=Paenalkalicoccus suaedae TaxID=2592382 RepID=A0A859FAH6_9BACI|nr:hypothetical protein [Paenalkalicoccus suaedae]QKS69920.1 hypothetical protein FLK61_24370 [Paenalkalicoccus suaedae]